MAITRIGWKCSKCGAINLQFRRKRPFRCLNDGCFCTTWVSELITVVQRSAYEDRQDDQLRMRVGLPTRKSDE